DHLVLALRGPGIVELHRAGLDPEVAAGAGLVQPGRGLQERLGRDAAEVQAGAAEVFAAFDQRHAHPELSGPDRRDVAAVPAADDDEVELGRVISHDRFLVRYRSYTVSSSGCSSSRLTSAREPAVCAPFTTTAPRT